MGPPGVEGRGDPQPTGPERFKLLASAVAGRSVAVAPVESPGLPAWTDGTTVFIDTSASDREQIRSLAVQASLLAAGSLGTAILAPLARRPALSHRYLSVEGHRALATQEGLLPAPVRLLIDPMVAARSGSPGDSLAIALSREVLVDPPRSFGTIRPRRLLKKVDPSPPPTQRHPGTTPHRRTARMHSESSTNRRTTPAFCSTPCRVRSVAVEGSASSSRSCSVTGALAPRRSPWRRCSYPLDPSGRSPPRRRRHDDLRGVHHRSDRRRGPAGMDLSRMGSAPTPVPAGLVHGQRSRADAGANLLHASRRTPTHCAVRSPGWAATGERSPRQLQGDDIDIDAVVAGPRRHGRRLGARTRSTSTPCGSAVISPVLILLDVSGSAGEPSDSGGIVHEHQRAAAGALILALHDLGDRVALYCFRSHGRSAVHVVPVKRFGERLDHRGRCTDLVAAPRRLYPPRRRDPPRIGRPRTGGRARRGGCWSSSRTGSPTTTGTRAAMARPTPVARWPRRGGEVPAACASALALPTDDAEPCAGSSGPPHTHASRGPINSRGGRPALPVRAQVGRGAAADLPAYARTRERLEVEGRTA